MNSFRQSRILLPEMLLLRGDNNIRGSVFSGSAVNGLDHGCLFNKNIKQDHSHRNIHKEDLSNVLTVIIGASSQEIKKRKVKISREYKFTIGLKYYVYSFLYLYVFIFQSFIMF